MTDDRWTERLSEYLDGELAPEERRELEGHLAQCTGCRETLTELRAVVARAAKLEDRLPAADLWPAVSQRIGAGEPGVMPLEPRRRRGLRLVFTLPQLAAAAVALMAISAGSVWLAGPRAARPAVAMRGGTAPSGVVAPAAMIPGGYDAAVRDLERVLAQNRGQLDTATVRVLERNLQLIDSAIAECRRALAADPASPYLNAHLADTMQQKLELLRQAARLAART